MQYPKAEWEVWYEKYRESELAEVVIRLTREVLKRGRITAEDAHSVPVSNPSIRGAAMKAIRRIGIVHQIDFTRGTTEASHGHVIAVWGLKDAAVAQALLRRVAGVITRTPAREPRQLVML